MECPNKTPRSLYYPYWEKLCHRPYRLPDLVTFGNEIKLKISYRSDPKDGKLRPRPGGLGRPTCPFGLERRCTDRESTNFYR